jgi:predicted O-methyltransferase YrrM
MFVPDEYVFDYINKVSSLDDDKLKKIREQVTGYSPMARAGVDRFLAFMVSLLRPGRILELGTFIGYSAILMATYSPHSEVVSVEINSENYIRAKENVKDSGCNNIRLIYGDALDVLRYLDGSFSFVFIDASKGHYNEYLDICLDKMPEGGVIIADNVLFGGRVAMSGPIPHKHRTIVKRMREFIERIMDDDRLFSCILPLADGLAVIRYKGD